MERRMAMVNQWQVADNSGEMGSTRTLRLVGGSPSDRRAFRRHDLENSNLSIARCDSTSDDQAVVLGRIVDLSAGGVRIRTFDDSIRPDQQIRVRLELPDYAGICPFIDTRGPEPRPTREWTGWMAVSRVQHLENGELDVGGRLVDMEEMDRGMLGLYLSTQPLAA
jgi:hypothetical protein